MADLADLVSRLEAVTVRLEKCAAGGGGKASAADDDDDFGKGFLYSIHKFSLITTGRIKLSSFDPFSTPAPGRL